MDNIFYSSTTDFFKKLSEQLSKPKTEYVALANVSVWASRLYGYVLMATISPAPLTIFAILVLIIVDTYMTYQISRCLMKYISVIVLS